MKLKGICICLLATISLFYRFNLPKEPVASIETKKEITVYVEGQIKQTLTYSSIPTVQEVLADTGIENKYNYVTERTLHDKQVLYIPEAKEVETLISINQATKEQLMQIPGIGPKTADLMIQYRSFSRYEIIEDIMNIKGIGEKMYYKIRGFLCL